MMRLYFVYILTDHCCRLLYTGMTNNLERRLEEHRTQRNDGSYTARYGIRYLVYFETHSLPSHAFIREREIKRMSRAERDALIRSFAAEEEGCPPRLKNPYAPPPGPGVDSQSPPGPGVDSHPPAKVRRCRPTCPW